MFEPTEKAVILARGLGTRMRAPAPGSQLTAEQELIASAGLKSLMPLAGGRTLLDMIIERLYDAGFTQVCLVIGPEHEAIRSHRFDQRVEVSFAVQSEALGTADAVLAAEEFVSETDLFLVINSDNLYPTSGLALLRRERLPSVLAFEREALIEKSNIPPERIAKFATIEIGPNGELASVLEKPRIVDRESLISMNAWIFSRRIFDACRKISLSERGEYELTAAVQFLVDDNIEAFRTIRIAAGVLDLSSRTDVPELQARLDVFEK